MIFPVSGTHIDPLYLIIGGALLLMVILVSLSR